MAGVLSPVLWFPNGAYAGFFRELSDLSLPGRYLARKVYFAL